MTTTDASAISRYPVPRLERLVRRHPRADARGAGSGRWSADRVACRPAVSR